MTHYTGWVACFAWLTFSASGWGIEYTVAVDVDQEVPAPVLDGATPSGTATVNVNTITGEISVSGAFSGLTSPAAASHIHGLAPAGSTAGVLVPLTVDNATAGSIGGGGTLDRTSLAGLLRGETYINVHTPTNGPGEIRGQIVDPDIRVYNLVLDASQANPTPDLGGAAPSGTATLVIDTSSGLMEVSGSYTGMTSDVVAAHLHGLADPGTNAGVLVPFTVGGGTEGMFSGSGTLSSESLAGLLAGKTYVNVHTANNPPGEIRAWVVPEPQSAILLLLGLLPFVTRRRRA